ncbi:hypothetical protein V2K54_25995, partial [Pseudomonas alliivorans]|nr:hypothetical protein [Pseudomonas alliivorans]
MNECTLQSTKPSPPDALPEKRKPGRPSTGKAKSRADIQRQYRQRNKSNVTRNAIDALDENIALRAQLLQAMDELDAVKKRVPTNCVETLTMDTMKGKNATTNSEVDQKIISLPAHLLDYLAKWVRLDGT